MLPKSHGKAQVGINSAWENSIYSSTSYLLQVINSDILIVNESGDYDVLEFVALQPPKNICQSHLPDCRVFIDMAFDLEGSQRYFSTTVISL